MYKMPSGIKRDGDKRIIRGTLQESAVHLVIF